MSASSCLPRQEARVQVGHRAVVPSVGGPILSAMRKRPSTTTSSAANDHARPEVAVGSEQSEPERLLLDQIAAGALDAHLMAISETVRARLDLLETINSQKALAELVVGDRVRINALASPRYLHGVDGTVVALDSRSATVSTHGPVGRFKNGEVHCPPLVLDRLRPAA